MQDEAEYDLDIKAAKRTALSPNNLDKYEFLTSENLRYKPSVTERAKFEYSPLGNDFTKGLEKDKNERLFKRLKNTENVQRNLSNSNNKNKPDSTGSILSLTSILDSISSKSKDEDEDENEKTTRELYQDGIKNVDGLDKLLGETKDEKSQMYLINNLDKIKNSFSDIYNKYQRFLSYIANEEKKILTTEYFQLKLIVLIFLTDMVLCTII